MELRAFTLRFDRIKSIYSITSAVLNELKSTLDVLKSWLCMSVYTHMRENTTLVRGYK